MKEDPQGFNRRAEELLDKYAALVYQLAFARTRSREGAEDVFQEVFLRLVSKRPRLESEEHEKAWFCRVTINCANSYWRNPFRRRTQPLEETGELTAPPPEEKTELDACLDKLSPDLRVVVHLYYYEGYQTAEIAQLTGWREGTVRSRLARARAKLGALLKGDEA